MSFIPTEWLTVFWEWVMWFHLVERAQEQFDEEQARRKIQKKIAKNQIRF